MQRHASAGTTLCSGCSPPTPPWSSPLPPLQPNSAFFPTSLQIQPSRKSWDDQRVEIILPPSAGLLCIPDLQPDWISHPLAHLCANVTLTSLTRRCHSLLAGSLFPNRRFYSGWSGKIRWHRLRGWILRVISASGRGKRQRPFPCRQKTSKAAFGCKWRHRTAAVNYVSSVDGVRGVSALLRTLQMECSFTRCSFHLLSMERLYVSRRGRRQFVKNFGICISS